MVTEAVPRILDKLLLRNSFVLNGRDLYEEFCFDDINALRVYNCQLGVYSFICAEGTPFYQHFLHVWSGSQWNISASPCAWLIVVVKKIMQFSIFSALQQLYGSKFIALKMRTIFSHLYYPFCFPCVSRWDVSYIFGSRPSELLNHSLVLGQLHCFCLRALLIFHNYL